ncbi:hemerythrin domain-containing protein [Labilibacter marinus]|uniref:hemerythrin domain-containing protein n=1 Tax=Labilibacter marinus TaxID=1477105 RepID=UPI00082F63AE|nr:hemerythrin domain-containing protein [Labilibacter marinus]
MSNLIEQLKKEHAALVEILTKVKSLGVSSEESKELLIQAKGALLLHLHKEDKELYPSLKKRGETDEDCERKLKIFAQDMDEITQFVLFFFDQIEKDAFTPMEYAQNFGKLVSTLAGRISREENILYKLYDKTA